MFKLATLIYFGIGLVLASISGCTTATSTSAVSPSPKEPATSIVPNQPLPPSPPVPKAASASPTTPDNTRAGSSELNFQDAATEAMFKNGQINSSLMKAAQLSPEQAKTLISLANANGNKQKFRIVLPSYIPEGYFLDRVSVDDPVARFSGPSYSVSYRDKDDKCFEVSGYHISGVGPEEVDESTETVSPLLGRVVLTYTKFDKNYQGTLIDFKVKNFVAVGDLSFEVRSSSGSFSGSCKTTPMKQIIKIVNSLDYLEKRTKEQEASRSVEESFERRSTVFTKHSQFDFPQKSCGDTRSQTRSESKSKWYPVFINSDPTSGLENVQKFQCEDAASIIREKTGKAAILAASFASREKATEFSKAVGGEVGDPNY